MSMSESEPGMVPSVEGRYFDGRSTRVHHVRVSLNDAALVVEGDIPRQEWALGALSITARLGSAPRRIELAGGAFIDVPDSPLWDALGRRAGHKVDIVAALERRWRYAVAAVFLVVATGIAGYVWGIPLAARVIANALPEEWIQAASGGAMQTLDKFMLGPSELSASRQQQLRDAFARWSVHTATRPNYTLHFRKGTMIGANALALPSGDIVVTDELIELANDDREILGVLAHELGHLHHRHSLRQLVQGAVVTFAAVWWFGDAGDIAGASGALLTLRYTRDFEREADDYAARMMLKNGVDPRRLGDILTRIGASHKHDHAEAKDDAEEEEDEISGYFQTHPLTRERMERLRKHAQEQPE